MIDRENLKAFVDGELTGPEADEIRRGIETDPKLRAEVDQMRAIGDIIRTEIRPFEVAGMDDTLALMARRTRRPWFRSMGFAGLVAATAAGAGIFFAWKSMSPTPLADGVATVAAMSPMEMNGVQDKAAMTSPAVVPPPIVVTPPAAAKLGGAESSDAPPKDSVEMARGKDAVEKAILAKPIAPGTASKKRETADHIPQKQKHADELAPAPVPGDLSFKPTAAGAAPKEPSLLRTAPKEELVTLDRTSSAASDSVRKLIRSSEAKVVSETSSGDLQVFVVEVEAEKADRLVAELRAIGKDRKADTSTKVGASDSTVVASKSSAPAGFGGAANPSRGATKFDAASAKKRTIRIEIPIVHPGKGPDKSE